MVVDPACKGDPSLNGRRARECFVHVCHLVHGRRLHGKRTWKYEHGKVSPLAEVWNGKTWSITRTTPVPPQSMLLGVDCTTKTACIAVGYSGSVNRATTALAERWDGAKWTVTGSAKPSESTTSSLNGISCISKTFCIAVGTLNGSSSLAERWNGSTWGVEPIPQPSDLIY